MLIMLYKKGGVHFRLLGTNGFHVKAKKERFTAASSRSRQNLNHENFTSSLGRLRQNIAQKSVPHVHHNYFSSFNQSNHYSVTLSFTLPSSNLKLHIKLLMRTHARAIKMKFHGINSGGLSWKTKCTYIFAKKINIQRNYPSAHGSKVLSSRDLNPGKNENDQYSEKKRGKVLKSFHTMAHTRHLQFFFSD